jgi:hypothetical protein
MLVGGDWYGSVVVGSRTVLGSSKAVNAHTKQGSMHPRTVLAGVAGVTLHRRSSHPSSQRTNNTYRPQYEGCWLSCVRARSRLTRCVVH